MNEPEPEKTGPLLDERRWEKHERIGYSYSPRTGHTVVVHGKSLFVFGGTDKSRRQQDLFEYNTESKIWSLVRTRGVLPLPRSGASGIASNGFMYVFGGYDGREGNYYNDLFCFDFASQSWSPMPSIYRSRPSERTDHIMALFDNSIYIFGGYDGKNRYKDMYKYKLAQLRWKKQHTTGDIPSSRFGHTGVVHEPTSTLITFGGWDGRDTLDDLHSFDFRKKHWKKLIPVTSSPPHRYRHTAVIYGDSLFIFGGVDKYHNRFNDLWQFCLNSYVWTEVCTTGNIPSSRTFHRAIVLDCTMYLLGGYDGTNRLHDLYTIHVGRLSPPSMIHTCAKYIRRNFEHVLQYNTLEGLPLDLTDSLLWTRDGNGFLRGKCLQCRHGQCEQYMEKRQGDMVLNLCHCGHGCLTHEKIPETYLLSAPFHEQAIQRDPNPV